MARKNLRQLREMTKEQLCWFAHNMQNNLDYQMAKVEKLTVTVNRLKNGRTIWKLNENADHLHDKYLGQKLIADNLRKEKKELEIKVERLEDELYAYKKGKAA